MSLPVSLAQTSNLVARPETSVALQLDGDREGDREGDGGGNPGGADAEAGTDADGVGGGVGGGAAGCEWSQSLLGPRQSMQSRAHIRGPTHIREMSEVVQAVICQPRDPNQGGHGLCLFGS